MLFGPPIWNRLYDMYERLVLYESFIYHRKTYFCIAYKDRISATLYVTYTYMHIYIFAI